MPRANTSSTDTTTDEPEVEVNNETGEIVDTPAGTPEAAPAEPTVGEVADWSLSDHPVVLEAINTASRMAAGGRNKEVTTQDDMSQEAHILVATNANLVNQHLADDLMGPRALVRWLNKELQAIVRPSTTAAKRADTYGDGLHQTDQ